MFQRKPRRFRSHSNGRSHMSRGNGGGDQARMRSHSFSNGQIKNNFRQTLSAEKLLEKYNALAKDAMSGGDKTLSENYLQHADHYMRIVEEKNKFRNQNRANDMDKPIVDEKNLADTKNKVEEQAVTSEEAKDKQ
jgi:hypothetical protein